MEQNCGAEIRGECAASVCTIYLPDFQAQNAKLRDRADALVNKLDEIFTSKEYLGIFTFCHVHGHVYTGKSAKAELEALREALKETEKP